MAKVSLRIYNRDIESLIDQGHLDEAIAHCRHILQTFPKHLETYRLLGKAYLEAKRYDEAIDIFSRTLMAVPDDFVSHVGMSIIRDEQSKLDEAIWHMQRAFECQPSNSAIQGELRRLFGRRDGMEPPKIRMTRGALAHMYVQGELYPQAISEIKAVLGQEADRDDMKVLLGRAYFHAGQRADASDICQQLLKRYPYCFDANRIMVELLQTSDSVETTQVYRHRVNELDPYATFAQGPIFRSNEVSDAAINLERYEYTGAEVDQGVFHAAGIGLGAQAAALSEPAWLTADYSSTPAAEPTPASQEKAADIPDFLRDAGWTRSDGAAEEPVSFDASDADSDLAPADMPDWLKAMAPEDASTPIEPSATDTPDEAAAWLSGLQAAAVGTAAQQAQPADEGNVPDWLKSLDETGPAAPISADTSGLPDWLMPEPAAETPAAVTPSAPAAPAASLETLGTSAQEQDDAIAWLESLASKHGAKPEELVTDPNARSETPPEWVTQARELGASQLDEPQFVSVPTPESQPAVESTDLPDWLMSEPAPIAPSAPAAPAASLETLGTSAQEQDDAIAWLESLASKHGAKPEELVTDPNARSETPPEWVTQARELGEARPETPASADETGMWLRDLGEPQAAGEEYKSASMDVSDWLSELDAAEAQPSVPSPAPVVETPAPAVEEIGLPDWLNELDAAEAQPIASGLAADTTPAVEEANLPEWLVGLEKSEPAPAARVDTDELPAWLKGEPEPPAQPEPAAASDWRPEEPESTPGIVYSPAPEPVVEKAPEIIFSPPLAPEPVAEVKAETPEPVRYEPEPELEIKPIDFRPAPPTPAPARMTPEPKKKPVRVEKTKPAPEPSRQAPVRRMTGMLTPPVDPALSAAQAEMNRGDIPAALEHYGRLIKRGKWLEEIIRDLRDALYRYPVEVTIWQTLGDAFMRENRLQEALDAYTKAEELLR